MKHIKQLKDIIPAIRNHHEYYDGTGYPDGLKGEAISLFARILAVADTVDAMAADRPYRKGRDAIFHNRGTQEVFRHAVRPGCGRGFFGVQK